MDTAREDADTDLVQAVLEGGPGSIPELLRTQLVSPNAGKIKIQHHGGYEHFERESKPDHENPPQPAIFRWTMRTKIAE
jgi:Family of unknown function (DUF5988)